MATITLPDDLYERARKDAADAGFDSVDAYVASRLQTDTDQLGDEWARKFFTPERLAELDEITAEYERTGEAYTLEESDARLDELRERWLKENRHAG